MLHDLVDIACVVIVGGIRELLKVLDGLDVRKAVLAAIGGVLVGVEHLKEQLFLDLAGMFHVGRELCAQLLARLHLHPHHHIADQGYVHDLCRIMLGRRNTILLHFRCQGIDDLIARHISPP